MRQRNQRFLSRTSPIGRATAIALFCLAGTNACLAQFATPKSAVEQPVTPGARNPLDQPIPDLDGKVKIDETGIVDLHVNDEDLSNVLQMLSIQSQKSILTSKNVSATVTANLYGVTFYEALDAILHVNGFGYLERGNFIYVYTRDELVQIQEASRVKVSKIFKLNYINATDGAEFCKGLLSEVGQIKTNGKTAAFPGLGDTPIGGEDYANESVMVVTDYEENVAEIEKMIKEVDTRPVQVLVEATVLQTSLNEANAFGVDFSVIADLSFTEFLDLGGPLNAVTGLQGGSGNPDGGTPPLPGDDRGGAFTSGAGNTTGPATAKFGIVWNDVAAFIRVLDEVSDTQIISRPNILALNRQPARVLVGRKVGYLNTTSTDTATTQSVEFLDTGTQLYLRPFVSPDGMIRMELKPQVSEAVIRTVTDAGGAAVTIPDEITNELTTNVMVRDGQTIVLGGLFRESTAAGRRQIPGLGDLPIIGLAFRGHDDETERSEIMFMITPTVVNDAMIGEQADRAARTVQHIRFGFREGLLPWSREKQTGMRLVKAEELARAGKTAQALSKIQSALSDNHFSADAINLREKLLNKKTVWPNRSMIDEITHGEMDKRLENVQPVARRGQSKEKTTASKTTAAPKRQPTAAGQPAPRPLADPFATSPSWSPPTQSTAGAEPASEPAFEPSTEPYQPFEPATRPQDPPRR